MLRLMFSWPFHLTLVSAVLMGKNAPFYTVPLCIAFFLEYHPKIKWTITVSGYYIVRDMLPPFLKM